MGFSFSSLFIVTEGLGLRKNISLYDFLPLYCSLIIPPSLYLFVDFTINPKRKIKLLDWFLFIPFFLQFIFQMSGLFLFFIDKKLVIDNINKIIFIYDLIDNLTIILTLFFIILIFKKIYKFEKMLMDSYSEVSTYSLSWLKKLLWIILIIWFLFTIPTILEQSFLLPTNFNFYPVLIIISLLIYWIGYTSYGFNNSNEKIIISEKKITSLNSLSNKTKKYHTDLLDLMKQEKIFLNPDLNLKTLSTTLGISSNYLSQIINTYENKNFFEFINSYRVEMVKEKINSSQYNHLNLLGIAMESGFKSKSTFNLAFKKITGQTPSTYKKKLQLSINKKNKS